MRGAEVPHVDRGWEGRQPAVTARLPWCGSPAADCTLGARLFVSVMHFAPLPVSPPARLTAACRLQDPAMAAAGRSGGAGATAGLMSWEDGELNVNLPGFCRHRDKAVG